MTFDPSQDFQIFDGSETVTYCQVGGSPVTVSGALREQLTTHEAQAGAAVGLQPTDVPFNLPAPNLSGDRAGQRRFIRGCGRGDMDRCRRAVRHAHQTISSDVSTRSLIHSVTG